MPDFGAYQNEIYLAGLSGRLPSFPMRFDELEAKAHAAMPASFVSYVAGAAATSVRKRPTSPRSTNGACGLGCSSAPSSATCRSSSSACGCRRLVHEPDRRDRALRPGRPWRSRDRPRRRADRRADGRLDAVGRSARGSRRRVQRRHLDSSSSTPQPIASWRRALSARAERAGFKAIVVTLDTWVTGWRPRDLGDSQLPTTARSLPRQLFFRSALRDVNRRAAREGPARRHCDMGCDLRQSVDLGRSALAALADQAAADRQGHMPSRRRAARHRRRRRWNLLFQSRRPPGQRRHSRARHAARGGRRLPDAFRSCSIPESAPGPTSSRPWRWARRPSGSAAPMPTAWRWAGPTESSTCCGLCLPKPIS